SSSIAIPPSPADANSDVAQDNPAPPRSWMPTTKPAAYSSRQHSISTFSMNGSPTCTDGSFFRDNDGPAPPWASCPAPDSPPPNVSDASTDTPPIPSSPVRAPNRMILLPVPPPNA